MVRWRQVTRGGVRLACREMGGQGEAVLLMHGLAGHAEEWAETAAWLAGRRRVVALEARGHGRSGRRPDDVSRSALVGDAAYVIEKLGLAPVTVVGESLGGLIGLSLAARRPDLVRALVVVDASPEGGGDEVEQTVAAIVGALRQWPVPFRDRAEAEGFFAARFGGRLAAQAWTAGLEQRGGALWPRFEVEVMARILREAISEASWEEWERIGCPTLIVRAGNGVVEPATARQMAASLPGARLVEIAGAAHDLHLDRPREWRAALSGFLEELDRPPS